MAWIGAAAVEDDGIYFTIAKVTNGEIGRIAPPEQEPRPEGGYNRQFIEDTLRAQFRGAELDAIGISMFGLIDGLTGTLLEVPRDDWLEEKTEVNLGFGKLFGGEVYVYHDSSTSAVGEYLAMKGGESRLPKFDPEGFVRIRVGAGVGVGWLRRYGLRQGGRVHPEGGHMHVVRRTDDPLERGTCRLHSKDHRDCLEGLLSEKALLARCGVNSLAKIKAKDPVWDFVADYLAQLCIAITTLIAPDMIVIGGRTMIDGNTRPRTNVFSKIHTEFEERIGGYPRYKETLKLKQYIRPSIVLKEPAYASLVGVVQLVAREPQFRVVGQRRIGDPAYAGGGD